MNFNKGGRWFGLMILSLFIPFQNCSPVHEQVQNESSQLSSSLEFLASQGKAVLEQKCASCHSPGSGVLSSIQDIMDTEKLIADGYIVMGFPQRSPLYISVIDDYMPKAPHPPLTAEEKDKLRVWLLAENATNDDLAAIIEGNAPPPPPPAPPGTYADIRNTIIGPRCLNCHGAGSPSGNLSTYQAVRAYVVAGSPSSSSLFIEVNSNRMPVNPPPLTAAEKNKIASWIQAGAPNN